MMPSRVAPVRVRRVSMADLPAVLALNNAAVPHVNRIDRAQFDKFAASCAGFDVATAADDSTRVLGFLVAMLPDEDYGSENFRWFKRHYPAFVYVDRIVVDPAARAGGIGRALYMALIFAFAGRVPRVTCEVNLDPPNPDSLAVHQRLGFVAVGQQTTGDGKTVCLMARDL